jgi:hypothetical protein
MSDCNHNYLWLGFASTSIGGPIPYQCPHPIPLNSYDLNGLTYVNPTNLAPLNFYTDEVLDSMLSLSRFTSLVRWDKVTDDFRPMRQTPTRRVILKSGYLGPEVSQNNWLWTGASDGKVTVGWIVRNYNYADRDRWDSNVTPYNPTPWIYAEFTGLDASPSDPLELVWFDDHKGKIIGNPMTIQASTYETVLPDTETGGGFGKSVAFLIQPTGDTPDRVFSELPDEPIGQISIDNADSWNEEVPTITGGWTYTFTFRTKPSITLSNYYFQWNFGDGVIIPTPPNGPQQGLFTLTHAYSVVTHDTLFTVAVNVYEDANGTRRVSGDIISPTVTAVH